LPPIQAVVVRRRGALTTASAAFGGFAETGVIFSSQRWQRLSARALRRASVIA